MAGGVDQIALLEILKGFGYWVGLVDYYENPPAKPYADFHFQISTLDYESVKKIAIEHQATLIATSCTDQALLIAARLSEDLSLNFPLSFTQAKQLTNKNYMKEVFKTNNIPSSDYMTMDNYDPERLKNLNFPLIFKPVDNNSSKGISLVANISDAETAFSYALDFSREKKVICEEFLKGTEISIDAFIHDGFSQVVMVSQSDKIPNKGNYFPIYRSLYPVKVENQVYDQIREIVQKVAIAFQLKQTPLLIQAIITRDKVSVIELSARIGGGLKHYFIKQATGYDILSNYCQTLIGETPSYCNTYPDGFSYMMYYCYAKPGIFIETTGFEECKAKGVILEYFITKTKGMEIHGSNNSSGRIAAVLFRGKDADEISDKYDLFDKSVSCLNQNREDIMLHGIFSPLP